MDVVQVITAMLERIEARDWPGMRALLHDDLVVEWPVSAERFVGADRFVAVQAEYPEGWSIRVLDVVGPTPTRDGAHRVASEIEVPQVGVGTFRAASFWTVADGLVVAGTEYWTALGDEPASEWRAHLAEPIPVPPPPTA